MKRQRAPRATVVLLGLAAATAFGQTPQNPSPMVETTRAHERLTREETPGETWQLAEGITLFLPHAFARADAVDLVVHYFGAAWIPQVAAARQSRPVAVVTIPTAEGPALHQLVAEAERLLEPRVDRVILTAFSAGYRGIRAVLDSPAAERVSAILLLDGLHTAYVPEGTVLAEGGAVDAKALAPFVAFARRAIAGERGMFVAHSEIFPGTFASTTETADVLITELELDRTPVLAWGPRGMQQLSRVEAGCLHILGFAGNSAPDHVDHFHAMPEMLAMLLGSGCGYGDRKL